MPLILARKEVGIYFPGASWSEHRRVTQFSFRALSNMTKSFISKPPSFLDFIRVDFLIFAGLWFHTKSKIILFTSSANRGGVSMELQMNMTFERARVLTVFILP